MSTLWNWTAWLQQNSKQRVRRKRRSFENKSVIMWGLGQGRRRRANIGQSRNRGLENLISQILRWRNLCSRPCFKAKNTRKKSKEQLPNVLVTIRKNNSKLWKSQEWQKQINWRPILESRCEQWPEISRRNNRKWLLRHMVRFQRGFLRTWKWIIRKFVMWNLCQHVWANFTLRKSLRDRKAVKSRPNQRKNSLLMSPHDTKQARVSSSR